VKAPPSGRTIPEPNHFVLMVPRLWSTSIEKLLPSSSLPHDITIDSSTLPSDVIIDATATSPSTAASDRAVRRKHKHHKDVTPPSSLTRDVTVDSSPMSSSGDNVTADDVQNINLSTVTDANLSVKHSSGFRIVMSGTKRQKSMLVDADSYIYQVDKCRGDRTYWRCCTRSSTGCGATVVQVGDISTRGRHSHKDVSVPGSFEVLSVRSKVISDCVNIIFRSATEIAEDALQGVIDSNYLGPCIYSVKSG